MKTRRLSIKFRLVLKKLFIDIKQTRLKDLRNDFFHYLKKIPDIIHLKNMVLVTGILSGVVLIMFFQRFSALGQYFEKSIPADGGSYTEGVIGQIDKINPLFINNEAEATANSLVYSGLVKIMPNNKIVPDLAESWTIQENGKVYLFKLKKNLKWQDKTELKADDVIFTINLIQNPDTRTSLSSVWQNIKVIKVNDYEIQVSLPNNYNDFLKVAAQPILPEHLLKELDPSSFKIAEFNTKPIGSGPYKFVRFDQTGKETIAVFDANEFAQPHRPYINRVRLRLYENFDDLYSAVLRKQVNGISQIPYSKIDDVKKLGSMMVYNQYLPRYKAVFFNLKNEFLAKKEIRQALSKAIDRQEIINQSLGDKAMAVFAPILPGKEGYDRKYNVEQFDLNKASAELDAAGWSRGQDGVRTKDGKKLSLRLIASNDAEGIRAGKIIKDNFKKIGVEIDLILSNNDLLQADFIRPRNFDLAIIGQNVGATTDLYSFWHSSQISAPGLNLSGLNDRKTDKLIELGRKSNDSKYRDEKYRQAQESIMTEVPAVFLYNPIYSFAITKNIKGFNQGKLSNPVEIINDISNWYIYEKNKK